MKAIFRQAEAEIYRILDCVFVKSYKVVRMHETPSGKMHSVLYQANRVPKDLKKITGEIEDIYDLPAGSVVIDCIEKYKRSKDAPHKKPSAACIRRNAKFTAVPQRSVQIFTDFARYPEQVDLPRIDTAIDGRV